ncbi:MAG: sigma-70 family RNA polymerase sigma factor [Myxococcales bacterium]|nr:sigma-70 family RNA polymerase sigma factor [Myxococcales bacterium]
MSTQTHNIEELLGNARWMERFAHTLCQDGDDLAQDAWLAALESGGPRPEQQRAWFATVMRNSFRMRLRGSQRRTQREQAVPEPQQPPIPDVLTQRLLVERRLGDHLLRLTESQREAILLHFYEGMSAADIGRQLGVPATTIRSRLERSLELLREALDDESDGDRGAWRLALAPLLDVPPASAISATALGVVAMSAKMKIAIGLALLLLIGGAVKMTLKAEEKPAAEAASVTTSDHQARFAKLSKERKLGSAIDTKLPGCPITGTVRSADDKATLANALVLSSSHPQAPHTTDAEGRFVIENAPEGELGLGASAEEHKSALRMVKHQCGREVSLVLERGGVLVEGTVQDIGGGPVAQASVGLAAVRQNATGFLPAISDENGHYSLRVDAGAYGLAVQHPAYVTINEFLAVGGTALHRDVVLMPAGGIRGRVTEAESGEAVVSASIEVVGLQPGMMASQTVHSDADGRFALSGLGPGRTQLRVRSVGLSTHFEVELGLAEERMDVEIELERGFTIAGYVVEKGSDKPVAMATVFAMNPVTSESIPGAHATSEDGYFEIHGLKAGSYMVMAAEVHHLTEMQFNTVSIDDDRKDMLVELTLGRTIVGRVQPPGPAQIMIDDPEGSIAYSGVLGVIMSKNIRADEEGYFELVGMPPIPLTIRATATDGQSGEAEAGIGVSDVLLTLEERPSLSGRLIDNAGAPLVGAWISLDGTPSMMGGLRQQLGMGARSDEEGRFRLVGLEPGDYELHAHDDHGERKLVEPLSDSSNDDDALGTIQLTERGIANLQVRVARADRTIEGTVLDEAGNPVADAWVQAGPKDAPRDAPKKSVLTDADGQFVLRDLAEGIYELTPKLANGEAMGATESVQVGERAELRIQNLVEVSFDIDGTSANEVCELRLSGATEIELRRPASSATVRVRPGDHIVEVECESGYSRLEDTLGSGSVTVELAAWASLAGRFTDNEGQAIPGLRVFAIPYEIHSKEAAALRMFNEPSVADDNGQVLVRRVPPGRFKLVALSSLAELVTDARKGGSREFDAAAGERLEVGTLVVDTKSPPSQ